LVIIDYTCGYFKTCYYQSSLNNLEFSNNSVKLYSVFHVIKYAGTVAEMHSNLKQTRQYPTKKTHTEQNKNK
jgi:hypothetical protein